VQRYLSFKGAVGCSWHTTNGSAVSPTHYTGASGTLAWADDEGGTKNITITIIGIAGDQGTRSFTVTIDTPTGGVDIGTPSVATVNIKESGAAADPWDTGSVLIQLNDSVGDGNKFIFGAIYISNEVIGYTKRNITANVMNQKIGTVIGFGNDFYNDEYTFLQTPRRRSRTFISKSRE
jgi:hypothetical protein